MIRLRFPTILGLCAGTFGPWACGDSNPASYPPNPGGSEDAGSAQSGDGGSARQPSDSGNSGVGLDTGGGGTGGGGREGGSQADAANPVETGGASNGDSGGGSCGDGGAFDPKLPAEPTIPPACTTLSASQTVAAGGVPSET